MEQNNKRISTTSILLLQVIVAVYTLSGVAGKLAAQNSFLSIQFILLYGLEIMVLGIYAILWQQIIKRFDLSVAYANRAVALLWSMLWAVLFFKETVSVQNVLGVIIVICGTMLVNSDGSQ